MNLLQIDIWIIFNNIAFIFKLEVDFQKFSTVECWGNEGPGSEKMQQISSLRVGGYPSATS